MFLLVSEARNLKSADSINNMIDFTVKRAAKAHLNFKDVDLEEFKIEMNEPAVLNIKMALECTPIVLDLEPLLIVEQTNAGRFITSDNPVVRHNSFYRSKNYRGGFGYVTRGLQLFFPISPHKCILLYDKLAYDIPGANNEVLILKRGRDVDQLNEFFYLNAYNNVFFDQKTKKEYIEGIHYKNNRTPKIKELKREVAAYRSADSNSELLHYSQNKVSKNINFSWIKNSQFANGLKIPSHMGGIVRSESPYVREALEKEKAIFASANSLNNKR